MSKELTVAELAADLHGHVAEVKGGETLTIVEEGKPIATITPTVIRRGIRYPFRDFSFGERPKSLRSDPADIIIEKREHERSGKEVRHLIAYIDASVLIRIILQHPQPLHEWDEIRRGGGF